MARTTLQINHDDAFGTIPAGAAGAKRVALRLLRKDIGKRQPQEGGAANTQEFAPGHAVAGGFAMVAWNHEHRTSSEKWGASGGCAVSVCTAIMLYLRSRGRVNQENSRKAI